MDAQLLGFLLKDSQLASFLLLDADTLVSSAAFLILLIQDHNPSELETALCCEYGNCTGLILLPELHMAIPFS